MSGLTKDTVVRIERHLKKTLKDGDDLRQQINETVALLQAAQKADTAALRGELEGRLIRHRDALGSTVASVRVDLDMFTDLGLVGRLRWLLTGQIVAAFRRANDEASPS